ncbi:MAG: cytidylate kinase [Deltaproteobacteria bacterium RBG_13_58_19]|nr:MAG: cytidylate kinase [Deltaproteobacteria bacterium RBG_13_58_19]
MARRGIITIDGPAGAGKSTVGRLLAQSLGYIYLDSGALYRAVAWQANRVGLDLDDPVALPAWLQEFQPRVTSDAQGFHLAIDGREVDQELRSPQVSRDASRVATLPPVRRWVAEHLRHLAREGGVVAEGRDMGTVVFPEAEVKIYLDASLAVRAARRDKEWQNKADSLPTPEAVMAELASRDRQDRTRAEAPLRLHPEALCLDTTDLKPEEVVQQCLARIRAALSPGQIVEYNQ